MHEIVSQCLCDVITQTLQAFLHVWKSISGHAKLCNFATVENKSHSTYERSQKHKNKCANFHIEFPSNWATLYWMTTITEITCKNHFGKTQIWHAPLGNISMKGKTQGNNYTKANKTIFVSNM